MHLIFLRLRSRALHLKGYIRIPPTPPARAAFLCAARALSHCETCARVDGAAAATGTSREREGEKDRTRHLGKWVWATMEARRVETVSARVDATGAAPGRTATARIFLPFHCLLVATGENKERDDVQNSPFETDGWMLARKVKYDG